MAVFLEAKMEQQRSHSKPSEAHKCHSKDRINNKKDLKDATSTNQDKAAINLKQVNVILECTFNRTKILSDNSLCSHK